MRKIIGFFVLFLLLVSGVTAQAQDFNLTSGKYEGGSYAGDGEEDYHYFRVVPSKSGYIALTVKTSDKKPLLVDICDGDRQVTASGVSLEHKQTVLHGVSKKQVYYIRIKGNQDATYQISYKEKKFDAMTYAKKYKITVTNASFVDEKKALCLKLQANRTGNLQFMCATDSPLTVKYLNDKKKAVSEKVQMKKKALSGIGVQNKKTYYIKIWNAEGVTEGTTTVSDMKFQILQGAELPSACGTRSRARNLRQGYYQEMLVPAGKTSEAWYKIVLGEKKKIQISMESRMFSSHGKGLQVTLYDEKGKKLNNNAIVITDEGTAVYKGKKYKMKYPIKNISPQVKFPAGVYYVKVASNTKTSSGSYRIRWK